MSTKNVDTITRGQCKAARALLELTQTELADAAKLGLSTIVDFEKWQTPSFNRRNPSYPGCAGSTWSGVHRRERRRPRSAATKAAPEEELDR
jgi:DNA-binding XRE family transcriptional regulator